MMEAYLYICLGAALQLRHRQCGLDARLDGSACLVVKSSSSGGETGSPAWDPPREVSGLCR